MDDLISRAEAIKAVKFYETFCDPYPRVIEALEELPSIQSELSNNSPKLDNENGELISRQEAIEVASRECHEFRGIFADIEKGLNQLPSAQPDKDLIHLQREQAYMQGYEDGRKSRTGKWITDNPHSEIYRYACSECHAHHRARYDFCPSCGCRMEEGDAE